MTDADRDAGRRCVCPGALARLVAVVLWGAIAAGVAMATAAATVRGTASTPPANVIHPAPTATPAATSIPATPAILTGAQERGEIARSPLYRWLEEHRDAAYWAAPLLTVMVAILPIPAEIPAAINGMLFGAVLGVLITWSGAMVGATISYELARYFGAGLTRRFVKPQVMATIESLRTTEAAVLLALRLTPVVAFTLINWACGLLGVRRSTFLWTTAVGILPGAVAFTISGSAMAVLYRRYPGTVSAVAFLFLVLIALRVWWKQRRGSPNSSSIAP